MMSNHFSRKTTTNSTISSSSSSSSSSVMSPGPCSPFPSERRVFTRKQNIKKLFKLLWHTGFGWYGVFLGARMMMFGLVLCQTFFQFVWWQMKSDSILRGIPYRKDISGAQRSTAASTTSSTSSSLPLLSSSTCSEGEENVTGNNVNRNINNVRAFLDLHFPLPTSEVVSSDSTHRTEGAYRFPVIVCVTGGGWLLGSHFWASFIGRIFADNGYLVVAPDYRNFPMGTITDMVEDVTDSVAWAFNHIERYGGDLSRITLMGQSAGSHLLFLSMIQQAQLMAAGMAPKYDPSKALRVIGLSGLYDMPALERQLHSRGLYRDLQHMMFEGKGLAARRSVSPLHLLRDEVEVASFNAYFPKEFLLMHGTEDISAPFSESEKMYNCLRTKCAEADLKDEALAGGVCGWNVELIPLEGSTHTSPYLDEPLMMRSAIVQMLCDRDQMPGPRVFESRKPMAGRKRLAFAAKHFLPF